MSLLRAEALRKATAAVAERRKHREAALQKALFGEDGKQVPAGFTRLERPEEKQLAMRYMSRQALKETEGFTPGDTFSRAVMDPMVQQAVAREVQGEAPNG